jgi:hypothetical protein
MQQRVVVVGIVRKHALVGVYLTSDVMIERVESDFVFFSLLQANVQIRVSKDPLESSLEE